jgi:hypothetical protein
VHLAGQGDLGAMLVGAAKTDSNVFDPLKTLTAASDAASQTH